MNHKIKKIFKLLDSKSAYYISNLSDVFYITGFSGTFAKIFITHKKAYFITDKRYEGEINNLNLPQVVDVIITKNFKLDFLRLIKNYNKILLSKKTDLTEYLFIKKKRIVFNELLSKLRMKKNDEEIEKIKEAIKITEKGFYHILKILKEGITERDISIEFEYFIKKNGADAVSFEPIIAFDENSAVPHHRTGNKSLKRNSIILIDAGVKVKGFCSDLTRVICYGIIKSRLEEIKKYYKILIRAKEYCLKFYKKNVSAQIPDKKVREYLKKYKLDSAFLHSSGHGLGIDIHEMPAINSKERLKLEKGMVLTCEPGIYFENDFGLRIEDDYLITDRKPIKLSELDEELIII